MQHTEAGSPLWGSERERERHISSYCNNVAADAATATGKSSRCVENEEEETFSELLVKSRSAKIRKKREVLTLYFILVKMPKNTLTKVEFKVS